MRNRQIWALWLIGFLVFLGTSLSAASQYTEKVVIPQYNPNNPTHVLITPSNGKWNRYVLNNPNYKHFYLKPGKYLTKINLTASGTKSNRRTLSLLNGNNTHPAALPVSQVADVRLNLIGASYWTLDRLSNINDTNRPSFYLHNGAVHNIINRLYIKNFYYGIIITNLSHNNTIQNSYFDHMTHAGRYNDNVGIAIYSDKRVNGRIFNTHIVNNDIRNSGDGIQLVERSTGGNSDYQGTIIDSNRIWFDGDAYTNGNYKVDGYSKNGKYMIGENAIDLKGSSNNPKNPVVISNNIMWGYLQRDKTVGGSFSADSGKAVTAGVGIKKNVRFNNNIIFNSQRAIAVSSAINWEVKNNIFLDMNLINPLNDATFAVYFYKSKAIKVENNLFKNIPQNSIRGGYLFRFDKNTQNSTFVKNVIIDAKGTSPSYENRMGNNFLYNSKINYQGLKDTIANNPNMKNFIFYYERFTKNPKKKVLKGIVTTSKSPHYNKAGSTIKAQAAYGGASVSTTTKPAALGSNTTVYENAEDGQTNGWDVYDNSPAGATISNFYDAEKQSFVIEFDGDGIRNGYRLGSAKMGNAFKNRKNTHIRWSMNYNQYFMIYISVQTTQGFRYLTYIPTNTDRGLFVNKNSKIHYIYHGLGTKTKNGTWQTVTRDLEQDIRKFEPNNRLLEVNGFLIRGNGKIDDIEMFGTKVRPKPTVYENAEDGKTTRWDIFDNSPAGATVSNVYDAQKRSRVIKLTGQGTENGYRLGYWKTNTEFKNKKDKLFRWSMNFKETFVVYIGVQTDKGFRYLWYTADNKNKGNAGNRTYIHHGLGAKAKNGTWQTFTRNLQKDLQDFEPSSKLLEVKSFLIRGSGKVDDVAISNSF